ncbi:hypothetical protein [uncultured Chryseobacterium sp.]|uniref:hypothetical protein n=1 Tax=uncultured Chryseobacterium sp. TaxID=259322 RepID=UPI0025FC669A|nr:hypothetical protein [uncultured Chryseobacterium sp.]
MAAKGCNSVKIPGKIARKGSGIILKIEIFFVVLFQIRQSRKTKHHLLSKKLAV